MSEYRRAFVPGGQFFLTLVTERRAPIFAEVPNVERLRVAVASTIALRPFALLAAVILPDHLHWIIELPRGDSDFSTRIGVIKATFTKSLPLDGQPDTARSASRVRHRERTVWQRRFWEHAIRDDRDYEAHMNYIHYNPVKHGLAPCPHAWPHSSFARWVTLGSYQADWACTCDARRPVPLDFSTIAASVNEP